MEQAETNPRIRVPQPTIQLDRSRLTHWLPSPGNVIFTLFVIGGLLWAQNVGAISLSAPASSALSISAIPYQGRLTDANGAPLTGAYNMSFRLYPTASGGTALWEEQWSSPSSVQISDGLFNVMLGSVTPIPQGVIASNSDLFLGITVGADAEMTPRVQLGSVPFAMQALTVPDGSVTTAKLADGAITEAKLNLPNGFTVRQGDSTYLTKIEGRRITMQDGPQFTGLTYLSTYWNNLFIYTDVGSVVIGGPNSETQNMNVTGNFTVGGTKSAVVNTAHYGQRKLYAYEQATNRFGDEGKAKLAAGFVRVELDPIFLETIEGDFLIHVTPYGDASLYVAELGADYFVVKAREGDPDVAFAWQLSAARKGYTDVRLEEAKK